MLLFIVFVLIFVLSVRGIPNIDIKDRNINFVTINEHKQCNGKKICLANGLHEYNHQNHTFTDCECIFFIDKEPYNSDQLTITGSKEDSLTILKTIDASFPYDLQIVNFSSVDSKQRFFSVNSVVEENQRLSIVLNYFFWSAVTVNNVKFIISAKGENYQSYSLAVSSKNNVISLELDTNISAALDSVFPDGYSLDVSGPGELTIRKQEGNNLSNIKVKQSTLKLYRLINPITIYTTSEISSETIYAESIDLIIDGVTKTHGNISISGGLYSERYYTIKFKNALLTRYTTYEGGCFYANLAQYYNHDDTVDLSFGSQDNTIADKQNFIVHRDLMESDVQHITCTNSMLINLPFKTQGEKKLSKIGTVECHETVNIAVDGYLSGEVSIGNIIGTDKTFFAFPGEVVNVPTKIIIPNFSNILGITIGTLTIQFSEPQNYGMPEIYYNYVDNEPFVYVNASNIPHNTESNIIYIKAGYSDLIMQDKTEIFTDENPLNRNIIVLPHSISLNNLEARAVTITAENSLLSVDYFDVLYMTVMSLQSLVITSASSVKQNTLMSLYVENVNEVKIKNLYILSCSFVKLGRLMLSEFKADDVAFTNNNTVYIKDIEVVESFASLIEADFYNYTVTFTIDTLTMNTLKSFNCQGHEFIELSGNLARFDVSSFQIYTIVSVKNFRRGLSILSPDYDADYNQKVVFGYSTNYDSSGLYESLEATEFVGAVKQVKQNDDTRSRPSISINFTSGPKRLTDVLFYVTGQISSATGFNIKGDITAEKVKLLHVDLWNKQNAFELKDLFTKENTAENASLEASRIYSEYSCESAGAEKSFYLPYALKLYNNGNIGNAINLSMKNCVLHFGHLTTVLNDNGPITTQNKYVCSANGSYSKGFCANDELNPLPIETDSFDAGESIGKLVGGRSGGNVYVSIEKLYIPDNAIFDVSGENGVCENDICSGSGAAGNIVIEAKYFDISPYSRIFIQGGCSNNKLCGGGGYFIVRSTNYDYDRKYPKYPRYFVLDNIYWQSATDSNYTLSLIDIVNNGICPNGQYLVNFNLCKDIEFDVVGFIVGIVFLVVILLILIIYFGVRAYFVKKYKVKFCGCGIPKKNKLHYTEASSDLEEIPVKYNSDTSA